MTGEPPESSRDHRAGRLAYQVATAIRRCARLSAAAVLEVVASVLVGTAAPRQHAVEGEVVDDQHAHGRPPSRAISRADADHAPLIVLAVALDDKAALATDLL